ncbi:hypothetical protein SAMN05880582_101767 [Rhizobium sp. RU20A]|uniref:NrsF family protein n=1 Tax=Rhizobium sp. RU20A TaxID=1907412 RepID=UPI000954B497|nr:NrsF family protein [Rhizobium sp. RU20A]SIQ10937.1 hypothetical protein SAMN05880582_101767 [Rhizobium sp. RU20A]
MKTDDLIRLMAEDARPGLPLRRALAVALVAGMGLAVTLFSLELGFREGLLQAMQTPRVLVKIAVVLLLSIIALVLVSRAGRPDADLARPARALLVPVAIIVVAVAAEFLVLPEADWRANLIGHNAVACLVMVVLMGAGPLAALLMALKRGAPESPARAGAIAGLAAGALAATLYALHCPDDSPFFVAAWYSIAIGALTLVGALAGSRVLRW